MDPKDIIPQEYGVFHDETVSLLPSSQKHTKTDASSVDSISWHQPCFPETRSENFFIRLTVIFYTFMAVVLVIAGLSCHESNCDVAIPSWMPIMGGLALLGVSSEYVDIYFCEQQNRRSGFLMGNVPVAFHMLKVALRFAQFALVLQGVYLLYDSINCDSSLTSLTFGYLIFWTASVTVLAYFSLPPSKSFHDYLIQ